MATYYINVFTTTTKGHVMAGCGSFNNITVDGRLSLCNAVEVAREYAKKECNFKGREYVGFAIKKAERLDFTNAAVLDCPTNDVLYL